MERAAPGAREGFALFCPCIARKGRTSPKEIARRPADRFRVRARFAQRQVIAHGYGLPFGSRGRLWAITLTSRTTNYQAGTNFPTQNDLGCRMATSISWKAVTRIPPDLLNE